VFNFVWNSFLDLPEGTFTYVYLRISVSDAFTGSAQLVIGPLTIVSEMSPGRDHLSRQLERRAIIDAAPGGFLGNGLVIPFRRSGKDFASGFGIELIKSSVKQILQTRAAVRGQPGELPWRPNFGSKFWILRHRKNNNTLKAQALIFAREALLWEPRVEVTGVDVETGSNIDSNKLQIRVMYQIITENSSSNAVVAPQFEVMDLNS